MAGWMTVVMMTRIVMLTSLAMVTLPPPPVHSSPLSPPSLHRSHYSGSFSSQRKLKIEPSLCKGPLGEPGTCMFNFECYQRGGHVVGTCIDGFLFGACCDLPGGGEGEEDDVEEEEEEEEEAKPRPGGGGGGGGELKITGSKVPSSSSSSSSSASQGESLFAIQNVELEAETGLLVPLDGTPEESLSNAGSVGEDSVVGDAIDKLPSTLNVGNELGSSSFTGERIVPGIIGVSDPGQETLEDEIPSNSGHLSTAAPPITHTKETTTQDFMLATEPSVAVDHLSSAGTLSTTEKPSTTTEADTLSTEPVSKFYGESETGIPDVLANGGMITFTVVESSTKESGGDLEELTDNTEKTVMMTLPDGQDGFATYEISKYDVTDPLLVYENTENPGPMSDSPEKDELYFEPRPTSHRPYVRPFTAKKPVKQKFSKTTTHTPLHWIEDFSHSIFSKPDETQIPVTPDINYLSETTDASYISHNEIDDYTTRTPYKTTTLDMLPELFQTEADHVQTTEMTTVTTTLTSTRPPETTTQGLPDTASIDTTTVPADKPATEPILIWTLSPQPSILNARPPESVLSLLTSTPRPSSERPSPEEIDPLLFWTVSPQVPIMSIRPQTVPTARPPSQNATVTDKPDLTDPLAFWTTARPTRPKPSDTAVSGDSSDSLLMVWTTTRRPVQTLQTLKLSTTPRPTQATSKITTLSTETSVSGLESDLTPIIPGDILQDIAGEVNIKHRNTTAEPWATSTYPIHTVSYDVQSGSTAGGNDQTTASTTTTTSTTTTKSTSTTTRKPTVTTRRPRPPPVSRGTTTTPRTTTEPTTEQPISPIDQFIVDFINSSPPEAPVTATTTTMPTTATKTTTELSSPPIDFNLLAQLFNLTNFVPGEDIIYPVPPGLTSSTTSTKPPRPKPTSGPAPNPVTNRINLPVLTSAPTKAATTTSTTTTTKTTTTSTTTTTTTTTTTPTTTPSTTTRVWDFKTTCGVRPLAREGRIVNGERSDFAEWPWQALIKESTWLGIFTKNKCGGVLLNKKYVLTAAHCQPGFLASLIVVLGEWDLSDDYEPKKTVQRNVKRVIVHKGYVAKTFDNDLALLEMERSVTFDEHIVPICMPHGDEDYTGMIGYVTGWGRLSYGGPVPTQLNEVQVPIIKNSQCQKWFLEAGHIKTIKNEFFCAGYKEGKRDSCEGDSGGPLSVQGDDGRWYLAGTVSHGIKCAYPNLPGVYMKMTYYKPWIESITG
ncbi:uncharacterized protein [Macrobrachium rosenbergii]